MAQGFDVQAARQAGYSDDDILGYLTSSRKFDVDGAIKAGYSKPDVIDHLASTQNTAATRQAQSKFDAPDARTPLQVGLDQARDATLGFAGSFIPDLSKPYMAPVDIAKGLYGTGKAVAGSLLDAVTGKGTGRGQQVVSDIANGLSAGPQKIAHAVATGDWGEAAEGAGSTLGGLLQMKGATPEGRAAADTAVTAVGSLPRKAADAGVAAIIDKSIPLEPEQMMVKGIKPRAGNLNFEVGLNRSMPELKAVEAATGKPITNVDELIDATKAAKQNIWNQYQDILGPQAQRGVDASPVADAIQKSTPLKVQIQNPGMAKSIADTASTYRDTFKLSDLEDMLHTTNAQLDAYYDKYPTAARSAAASNPETAALAAEAKGLRDLIYKRLDSAGDGAAPAELKQRYGSLLNLEEEAYRRRNVAARQQPDSLTDQMGKLQAGMKLGGAALKVFTDPTGAAVDVGSALAGSKISHAIKAANSTDSLIKTAMARYSKLPVPVPYEPMRPPLLEAGTSQLPETGTWAEYARGHEPEPATPITTPYAQVRRPLQLPSASTDLPITGTIQRSSGQVFEMPPKPPAALLGPPRLMLPAHETTVKALPILPGGYRQMPPRQGLQLPSGRVPIITPLRESLLEKVRRLAGSAK